MAYREPEETVRVELSAPSYAMRLRREVRGVGLGSRAFWPVPISLMITGLFFWCHPEGVFTTLALFITVYAIFFMVRALPTLVSALLRASTPNPLDAGLPRAFVFRASGILVEPRDGEGYERRWPYFHRARRTFRGVELVLSYDPYLLVAVRRRTLRPKAFERLTSWLTENRLLR